MSDDDLISLGVIPDVDLRPAAAEFLEQYPAPMVHADWKWRRTDSTNRVLRHMSFAEYDEWFDHLTNLMQQAQENRG